MTDQREVIKEFLASLGYQVDAPSARKFLDSIASTSKVAANLGKTIAGVAVAAEAMVTTFAFSMEKLYYSSRRTHASVENLQALRFGAAQIGIAAETAQEALEAMAAATRTNPGLRGLLDSLLGKKTEKMDQMRVMMQLIQRLSAMPHFVGAQFAQMFGMDERTFFMMKDQLPRLAAAEEKRRQMNREAGIDAQAAAAASREYANSLGELWERVKVLGDKLSIDLLPYFRDFNDLAIRGLRALTAVDLKPLAGQIKLLYSDLKETVEGAGIDFETLPRKMARLAESDLADLFEKIGDAVRGLKSLAEARVDQSLGKGTGGARPEDFGLPSWGFGPRAFLGSGATASFGISIDQKTDIHVLGAGDPAAVAREVGAAQSRVNGDLVRNLSGAIR